MVISSLLGLLSLGVALRVLAARRRRRFEASVFAGLAAEFEDLEVETESQGTRGCRITTTALAGLSLAA